KALGRQPRGRRKKREPGRGHYDKDRPAIIAWVSGQGGVVIHATRDFTVKTVQKAADLAMQAGSKLYTDSASSYRLITGYAHDSVNHTQKEWSCTSILRVMPSPAHQVQYPHFTTCVRGFCHGITPLFLPANAPGASLA